MPTKPDPCETTDEPRAYRVGAALVGALLTSTIAGDIASVLIFVAGIALMYRFVPTNRPTWQMIGRPAITIGLFSAAFTSAFALLTPQLVGSLQVYGAFVAILAAMVWLSFVCQALLIGAAWVHQRMVRGVGRPSSHAASRSLPHRPRRERAVRNDR